MRRADRLFQIVQILRDGRLHRACDIADKLEVSERTIYRDIADLIGTGVPVEGAAGMGYMMRDGYDLPPLMFTEAEIVALVAGARLIRAYGGNQMAAQAEDALSKINAVLPDAAKERAARVNVHAMRPAALDPPTRALIDQLEDAVDRALCVTLDYRDKDGAVTARTILPLGLWFWGGAWTVMGWCLLRDDFRTFRVDRISAAERGGVMHPEPHQTLAHFYATRLPPEGSALIRAWERPAPD